MTEREIKTAIERYVKGEKAKDIAKDYGVSIFAIRYHLRKNKSRRKDLIQKRDETICKEYLNGIEANELAKKFKITKARINQILRANKIPLRKYKKPQHPVSLEIIRLYKKGISRKTIAEMVDRHINQVTAVLIRNGIKLRKELWVKKVKPSRYFDWKEIKQNCWYI
jgi:transposase